MSSDLNEALKIAMEVLKDWRVIVITVAMILVISFTKYITSYHKKKPKKSKKKKAPVQPVAAPPSDSEKKSDETETGSQKNH
jgi:hypothetical protein